MTNIVILYYSRDGSTRRMANQIARGVSLVDGCEPVLRTVAEIHQRGQDAQSGDEKIDSPLIGPIISKEELRNADGLIVGSPTRFGNMAAPLKYFFDSTSDIWLAGELTDKPAAVFTSSSSMHGGQESTLFTMMLPLLHHGMIMVGLPYTEASLSKTERGGTPYGASQVADESARPSLDAHEKALCTALGKRVASIASRLL